MCIGSTVVYHIVYMHCNTCCFAEVSLFSALCMLSWAGERGAGLALLGSVWWACWLWCSCNGLQTAPSAHCGAASGDFGCPAQPFITATHCTGRWPGSYQYTLHASSPNTSILAAQLTLYQYTTLFHREEDPAWEPGDRSPRERLQIHGEDNQGLVHLTVLKIPECNFLDLLLSWKEEA